jgi:two-component system sensor histidine kinase/response regulator
MVRERQELVNLVAHDLKNPLTSVLFASDILIAGGVRTERVPRYLEMVRDSANDALGYIKRYLETQADKADGSAASDDGQVPLREVVAWIAERYELQLEGRDRRLLVTGADCTGVVAMDGLVLRQVAENLISNAMKYAPDSDVELSAHGSAPGFWQLVVEDRGPGIPPRRQRELFKPFTRLVEHDPTAGGTSSGLGLSLAKQIVAGAGGQLWYEDREGGGARFIIELPEADADAG